MESHLTVLRRSAALKPTSPLFKLPVLNGQRVESWKTITYQGFIRDVEAYARYWRQRFEEDGIPSRSVIGLWIGGFEYRDYVHIYAVSMAGYIPQLTSLRLPNPDVIYELMQKADAKALIYEPSFESILCDCPVPKHATSLSLPEFELAPLPKLPVLQADDTVFIFHTSGSTSGIPKLVPCSVRWIDSVVQKSHSISRPRNPARQDVTVAMGSMSHIGQTFMFIGSLQHNSCVIVPTKQSFDTVELCDMINSCGLNRLNQFGAFLGYTLRAARSDQKLLALLSNLDELLFSGLVPREEEEWAFNSGLQLRNLFGSTECGVMLLSAETTKANPSLLSPIEGFTYKFQSTVATSPNVHQSTGRLMELIIPAESPDCPHVSLRNQDGDFHTGDLFQEVSPGVFVFRGRDDDWIKSESSLRCDTKAIEDNAITMCGNLIAACVVVGSGRPSPAIFIEPSVEMDQDKLKKEILRKTRQFHSRRYIHERITTTDLIFVVPPRSLPRTATKGNIRRKAVEEAYKAQLDEVYQRLRR